MNASDLELLLKRAKKHYSVRDAMTLQTLSRWVEVNPALAMVYPQGDNLYVLL